ncbi:MAG: hypothetical protein IJ512_07725 [Ruminococcus sp.]|nr:hypothetical protein [Ruminococcus sp.]
MKASTIVAIILATGAVVLATLVLLSKLKKKSALSECGCELDHTDACCCTDTDCCDDLDECVCDDLCNCVEETVDDVKDAIEDVIDDVKDAVDAE